MQKPERIALMTRAAISGTGVFTPSNCISNEELMKAFIAWADLENAKHARAIKLGEREPIQHSSPLSSQRLPAFKAGIC